LLEPVDSTNWQVDRFVRPTDDLAGSARLGHCISLKSDALDAGLA
jgi:hypothetical protein